MPEAAGVGRVPGACASLSAGVGLPCHLTHDHFCSKGIMTHTAGISKPQRFSNALKGTANSTQPAKGFGQNQNRERGVRAGGALPAEAAFHSTCCQLLQKGKASPPRKKRGDARRTAGRVPPAALLWGSRPAPAGRH